MAEVAGRLYSMHRSPGRSFVDEYNAGLAAATADIVAFTDDDTEPAPEWLAQGLRAIEVYLGRYHRVTSAALDQLNGTHHETGRNGHGSVVFADMSVRGSLACGVLRPQPRWS